MARDGMRKALASERLSGLAKAWIQFKRVVPDAQPVPGLGLVSSSTQVSQMGFLPAENAHLVGESERWMTMTHPALC